MLPKGPMSNHTKCYRKKGRYKTLTHYVFVRCRTNMSGTLNQIYLNPAVLVIFVYNLTLKGGLDYGLKI